MARLTEREIFDRMKSSIREAISDAEALARGDRGPIYARFRENIELIYGCTRQAGCFRDDSRWLSFGVDLHKCREMARHWLVAKYGARCFRRLADILRAAEKRAAELETKRTGKRGIILPKPQPSETVTQGRSILVPPGFKDIRKEAPH